MNLNATVVLDLDKQIRAQPIRFRGRYEGSMLSFQKLRVYQRSIEFLALAIEVIRDLPKGNDVLADQLMRAAQSQPRSIAEGAGRRSPVDQARFYAIARGSAMEAAATLDTMLVMETISRPAYDRGIELLEGIVAMLTKMC